MATVATAADSISAGTDIVQALAILIAGAWAYWKFARGRTFRRRAELTVDDADLVGEPVTAIRARATFRNTGGADIPIRASVLRAFVNEGDELVEGEARWQQIVSAPLFLDHEWIESQETIHDDVLIPLPDPHPDVVPTAYRVTALTVERRGRRWKWFGSVRPGGVAWTAHCIVMTK